MSAIPQRGLLAVLIISCAVLVAASSMARPLAVAETFQETLPGPEQPQSARIHRFREALAKVRPLLERYGYAAVAAAILAEGIGIPTPGQTLLIAGALEAAAGRMNIVLLLFVTLVAAIAGNSIGYAIGRWGGRFAFKKLHVNRQREQRLDELFRKRGGMVVVFGRFVDGLRQLNGIVAGTMNMSWWVFTAYNAAGAILWIGAWGIGTYYLDRRIHVVAGFFHHHRRLLVAISAAAAVALLVCLFQVFADDKK